MVIRSRKAELVCVVVFVLLAAAPGAFTAELQPLVKAGDRIAIFGDSISSGKCYGYFAIELMNKEQPDLKLEWIEHGHPGWKATDALTVVKDVLDKKPTLVTIMFGTNDLGQEGAKAVAEIGDRDRKLVRAFKQAGVRVVLLTPPLTKESDPWCAELNRAGLPRMGDILFALGREENVPVFDMFTAAKLAEKAELEKDPKFTLLQDGVHPTEAGHRLMGRALADFLLGKAAPPRVPFAWKSPGTPVGRAPRVVSGVGAIYYMKLDQKSQIVYPERWKGPADLSAKAWAVWDDTSLHINVDVTDDVVLAGDKQPAWGHDGIEFFFDTRPLEKRDVAWAPGYFQILVAAAQNDGPATVACGRLDQLDPATVKANYRRTPEGYVLEIAIPWKSLRFTPTAGADIGFDFAINDRDDPKVDRRKALWRGSGDDFTNAGSLGMLRLE